ncbi:MAG: hypothetical protein IJT91_07535 [Clostridia bacterium]|nr:hypothetical protein [Clostridia bacterium]
MNNNIPDPENITDAVSGEYRKTKRLFSDFKKGRVRTDFSVDFSMPGIKRKTLECSSDMSAVKALIILIAAAALLLALIVCHMKVFLRGRKEAVGDQ